MKRPNNDAHRILAHYRRAIEPSEDQLVRVRARLGAPRRSSRRRVALAAGLGCAAAAAVLLAWLGLHAETATPDAEAPSVQAQQEAAVDSDGEARNDPPSRSSAPSSTNPTPAASPPKRVPQRPNRNVGPPAPSPSPAPSALRLAAEAELIRTAEAQLRAENFTEALKTLRTHARSFPAGTLIIERRALRSIALCRTGNLAQGRGEGAALRRDPAGTPYRDRIAQACK